MRDQVLSFEPWEMLDHFPEAYFLGDEDMPPTQPLLGHIEVSVEGKLAFDLRNLVSLNGWEWSVDDNLPQIIEHDLWLLDVEGQPRLVTFWFRGGRHTVFHLFYEEIID